MIYVLNKMNLKKLDAMEHNSSDTVYDKEYDTLHETDSFEKYAGKF